MSGRWVPSLRRRRPDGRRQRGAALLEMALLAPFLLLLLFGVAEFSFQFVTANRLGNAAATAGRVGSSSGSTADADRNIMLTLQASLPERLRQDVVQVVVFRSNATGSMATSCANPATPQGGGQSGGALACNVYGGALLRLTPAALAATNFDALDNNWEPETRADRLVTTSGPDYIGVRVVIDSDTLTDTFWSDVRIIRQTIYRIAPDIDG